MPDFTSPSLPPPTVPPQYSTSAPTQNPDDMRKAAAQQAIAASAKNQPLWMSSRNETLNSPVNTKLTDTTRYNDPNLGYDVTDPNMEDEYAHAHPVATFRNNLIKGTVNFVTGGIESLATIPIAIGSMAKGDFTYNWDNPVTNEVQDILKNIDTALPTYQTNYERDHPIGKYLNPLQFTSWVGAIGGQVNNFAGMTGYIAGAFVEDALITAATGGSGLLPAIAAEGIQLDKLTSVMGKAMATAPEDLAGILNGTDKELQATNAAERSIGVEGAAQDNINATKTLASDVANKRALIFDRANTYYKARDLVKYNLALLTSATSQGVFQASDNYTNTKKELEQNIFDQTGREATPEELAEIDKQSKLGANVTLGTDIALLYLSNKIRFGSLFSPTNKVFDDYLTGWGKNVAKGSVTLGEDEAGNLVRTLSESTPETKIGKILLNGGRVANYASHGVVGALEFAGLNAVSDASQDYIKNKYNAQNRGEVGDFIHSFLQSTKNTPNTSQGLDAIVNGLIGGMVGGLATHGIEKATGQAVDPKVQLQNQVDILNSVKLRQLWEENIKIATTDVSLGKQHKDAVQAQDIFTAKSIKDDLLTNYFAGATKVGKYNARVEEVNMLKDLTGASFKKVWGVEDTPDNRTKSNKYLDGILEQGKQVKSDIEKVQRVAINPFDPKTNPKEFSYYESVKDNMSYALSKSKFLQDRTKKVINDLTTNTPSLDIDKAIKLTSFQGLQDIGRQLRTTIDGLGTQIAQTEGNSTLQDDLYKKHAALSSVLGELQPLLADATVNNNKVVDNNFIGANFLNVMHNLYSLHDGINFENNSYIDNILKDNTFSINKKDPITNEQLADNLEKLQDLYKLDKANTDVNKYYNTLRTGRGAADAMDQMQKLSEGFKQFQKENGELQTPDSVKEEVRQDEYAKAGVDPENTTAQDRNVLKNAAQKVANGQTLSLKEQELSTKHEDVFTKYVKVEQSVKEALDNQVPDINTSTGATKASTEEQPKTASNKEFEGVTPENMLVGLYKSDFLDKNFKAQDNLRDVVFNTPTDKIGEQFSARLEKRPALKPGEQRNVQYINRNNTDIKLLRRDFDEAIQISNDGKLIGELRPPESILDVNKESIFDKDGNLTITPDNYQNVTGNDPSTYDKFKNSLESYKKSYDALHALVSNGANVDAETLKKHFDYTVNLGSTTFNRADEADKDVLLKDTKLKNKAVVEINANSEGGYDASVLKVYGDIGKKDSQAIQDAVNKNPEHFAQYDGKLMAVFPVDGVVSTQSFIRGRLPEGSDNYDNLKLATTADVFKNFTINFRPKGEASEEATSAEKPVEPPANKFSLYDKLTKEDEPTDDIDECNKQVRRKLVRKPK